MRPGQTFLRLTIPLHDGSMPHAIEGDLAWMQDRARLLDQDARFPDREIDRLRRAGLLAPELPVTDFVRNDRTAEALAELLIWAGRANLAVGRIVEAHINTLHLVARYGSDALQRSVDGAVSDGCLFGLWVTDPPTGALTMRRVADRIVLSGSKQFCSGAGAVGGTLVTAHDADGQRWMLVFRLGIGERVTPLPSPLAGMRAAVTGEVDFSGCEVPASSVLGEPGDYLREPDFSAGAWRGSAVALGGLIALIDEAIVQLRESGRIDSPHTQARLGQIFIARETAQFWVRHMALMAEDPTEPGDKQVATVGLGRIAVETACLDAMQLIQRSIGLTAFRGGSPIERICRDLSTYLRQPAPDDVLTYGARWYANQCLNSR